MQEGKEGEAPCARVYERWKGGAAACLVALVHVCVKASPDLWHIADAVSLHMHVHMCVCTCACHGPRAHAQADQRRHRAVRDRRREADVHAAARVVDGDQPALRHVELLERVRVLGILDVADEVEDLDEKQYLN